MRPSVIAVLSALIASGGALAASISEPAGLAAYQREAGSPADAERGRRFWSTNHVDADGQTINCTSCHGVDLTKTGKHNKSGKLIQPMSRTTNAERYTDGEKVEKWFKRNCKQVLGRECTAREKSDVLLFLGQS